MLFRSKGMAYLHKQGVLHGDLKVRIPVVKADLLVIGDTRTGCEYTRAKRDLATMRDVKNGVYIFVR